MNMEEEEKKEIQGAAANNSSDDGKSTTTTFGMKINYKLCFHGCKTVSFFMIFRFKEVFHDMVKFNVGEEKGLLGTSSSRI